MKKYTTDFVKLIALAIVTPMLVMAYTTIEKTISTPSVPNEQLPAAFPGITPASIKYMDRTKPAKIVNEDDHILVKYTWPLNQFDVNEKNGFTKNRFSLVLL